MLARGSSRDLLPLYFPALYICICILLPMHFAYVHGARCPVMAALRPLPDERGHDKWRIVFEYIFVIGVEGESFLDEKPM